MTLVGKGLYRTACRVKLAWDAELTGRLKLGWEQGLPKQIALSRALADRREPIQEIKVARYSFSRSIPPKFERKLRRHKQRFGKIDTTVVLDKDETLL